MVNTKAGRQEPTVLQVFIFREGRFWGTECFAQKNVVMGRSPDVDLQLDDDVISRSHATASVAEEGIVLEDLGSSNGTFVNGEPVERCLVGSRDEISIGSFTLKFKLLGRKKQEVQPRFETRIVDREEIHDDTAIHPRDELEAYQQEQAQEAIQPEYKPGRREEIAAALREELAQPREMELLQTQRSIEAPRLDTGESQEAGDEYAVVTQVEDAPEGLGQEPPAVDEAVSDEYAQDQSVPDHGTRWLTPEPGEGPSLSLADELEPSAAQARPIAEPAPLPEMPAAEPARPVHAEPDPDLQPEPPLPAGVEVEELEEDEEEEYQRDFVEPFSLLNNLIRENFAEPQVPTETNPVVEVIGYSSEKQVLSYDQVSRGRRHRIGPKRFVLVRHDDQNACRIMFGDDFSGGVITGGRTVSVDELKTSANQLSRKKGKNIYSYQLMKGDYANLIHEGGGSFVRFVLPPKLPPAPKARKLDTTDLKVFGSSFLAHVIFIVLLGILAKQVIADDDVDIDRFAKVDMKDIMEKQEVEAEVPLDQLPEPEEVKDEKAEEKKEKEEPKKEEKKKRPKRRRGKSKTGSGGGSGGGAGMMAALGNLSQKQPSRNIVAAVSNLDAVRVPGGRSRYKVSGLVTKLPTSSVVVSRGRGVGVKAGIDLLRGGKGRGGLAGIGPGALSGGRTGKRGVGGVVFKAPKRKMRVRGHLSREAVAQVVKKHLREIQYCYEKNLLLSPKLAGKLIMEWTINMAGSVSVVKTQHNSMKSPAVAMCISAKIKGWKFPKPKGGVVEVSYPFIFNSIGF